MGHRIPQLLLVPEAVLYGEGAGGQESWKESKRCAPYSTVDIPKITLTTFVPIYILKNNQHDL